LPLAGGLLRAGWSAEAVVETIRALGWETEEPGELERIVESTAAKLADDRHVSGWPSLAKDLNAKDALAPVLRWLGYTDTDLDDGRPAVRVTGGDLDKISDRAWEALAASNEPAVLFRRSNQAVRVERIDDTETHIIVMLDDVRLRHLAAEVIRWYKLTKDGQQPAMPPLDVIKNMKAYPDIPLPVLNRVGTAPVFSPGGVLQTEPGYHPEAKVYYVPSAGLVIPPVPANPNEADMQRAKALLLDELLVDFPFATGAEGADKAHAAALALLPFVRDMIDGPTSLHMFDAPTPGTGKGLLVRVVSALFMGGTGASETPVPAAEEEVHKNLFSLLMEGHPFILLDNITSRLDSSSLAAALTSITYRDRKLGVSETPEVPVRCAWVATANNPKTSPDIARRMIRYRMMTALENPELRAPSEFKHPELLEWVHANRGALVWSLLTLAQAWVAAGRPRGKVTLGSYESWARVIGGILDVAGIPGFLGNVKEFQAGANEDREVWREFITGWWFEHGPTVVSASELRNLAVTAGIPLKGWETEKQTAELGTLLKAKHQAVHAECQVLSTGKRAGRRKGTGYRLKPLAGQEWARPPSVAETLASVRVQPPARNDGAPGARPSSGNPFP
jgi:putative DNA primase/helicase